MAALAIEYQPMTTVLLYGQLRQFGRSFRLSVRSPAEAIKALFIQIPGFERFIANANAERIEFSHPLPTAVGSGQQGSGNLCGGPGQPEWASGGAGQGLG